MRKLMGQLNKLNALFYGIVGLAAASAALILPVTNPALFGLMPPLVVHLASL